MDFGTEGDGTGLGCLLLSLSDDSLFTGDPATEELLGFGLLGFTAGVAAAVPPLRPFEGDGRTGLVIAGDDGGIFTGGVSEAGRGNCGGDLANCCGDLADWRGVVGSAGSVTAVGRSIGGRTRAGTGRGCSVTGADVVAVVGRVIEPKRNHGRGS